MGHSLVQEPSIIFIYIVSSGHVTHVSPISPGISQWVVKGFEQVSLDSLYTSPSSHNVNSL